MEYLFAGLILVIAAYIVIRKINQENQRKKLQQIRASWINRKTEPFYFDSIRKYADAVDTPGFHRLTEQTMTDVDFNELFAFADRTTSKIGQQYLFKKMIEPTGTVDDKAERLIQLFMNGQETREEVQLELLKLAGHNAYHIPSLLRDRPLEKPRWLPLLAVYAVAIALMIVLSFKFRILTVVLLVLVQLNVYLHYRNRRNAFQFAASVPQLDLMIGVSNRLMKKGGVFYEPSVTASLDNLKSFQRTARIVNFGNLGGVGNVGGYLLEFLKIFFLLEIFALVRVREKLRDMQPSIRTLVDYVGTIDAAISVASLRAGSLKTCQPTFTLVRKEMILRNVYHPLITDCVKNSLTIKDRGVLITGSNMSGKSTFLRTLVINSILAQTLNTCFADEFTTPVVKQFSSIRISDNVFEGKSYYFQEVNSMGSLIAEVNSGHQNLFVLDEIFKGTNTIERIASAKAILSYLNRNGNISVVSTHDIELVGMLDGEYDLYHFTETIEGNELQFDHCIKPGPVRTRNAIKILELSHYPADIIDEARHVSTTLRAVNQ